MAVAALVVAIIAVVVAVFAAVYARTQALAAKGSLAIEQERHQAEQAPRFDAEITSGNDPELRLRLLPGQLPMTGVGLRIVQGSGVSFTRPRTRRTDSVSVSAWDDAQLNGVLFPGAQETWTLDVHEGAYGTEVTLEVSDLGRPGRVAAVTVTVPPRARMRFLEA
jgi:hypothetical protein